MACFLGCFGFPSKRKRRKPATRILPGDQNLACYEPLESAASAESSSSEQPPVSPNPSLGKSNKAKEQSSSVKIRKKVSFNLDVQTYEPIQVEETAVYYLLASHQENEKEEDSGKAGDANPSHSSTSNYPSNYRYLNCRDSYDEEDGIADDESDLDYDDEYDDETDDYDGNESQVVDDQTRSKEKSVDRLETRTRGSTDKPLVHVNQEAGGGTWPGCTSARIRNHYSSSVLSPIENTSQWKAMKASAPRPCKHKRKENIEVEQQVPSQPSKQRFDASPFNSVPQCNQSRPLLQDIAVNASVSNWLGSPGTRTRNSNKLSKKSMRDREMGIFQTSLEFKV